MSGFAIVVEFGIRPGRMAEFRDLIVANATASVRDEPGCQRFDVLGDPAGENTIVLYEVYDDEAAFNEHTRSPHYLAFADASRDLVSAKTVRSLNVIAAPGAALP
jgi:autoinducer 2-degrading protein